MSHGFVKNAEILALAFLLALFVCGALVWQRVLEDLYGKGGR